MFDLSENLQFSVHGGGDGDGMASLVDGFLSEIQHLLSLPIEQSFQTILPGISAMENIHPLLVHFPIALLFMFFLIDFSATVLQKPDWRSVAGWFLYLGAVFAGLTMLAGFQAASTVPHGENVHEIMETHEHLGVTIFSLASLLSVWRLISKPQIRCLTNFVYLFCAGSLCLLLIFAADLGGLMVYHYGVAVQAARTVEPEGMPKHEHHHHEHAD